MREGGRTTAPSARIPPCGGRMVMCGRFTVKATWAEIVAMYRLVMEAPAQSSTPLQRLPDCAGGRSDPSGPQARSRFNEL